MPFMYFSVFVGEDKDCRDRQKLIESLKLTVEKLKVDLERLKKDIGDKEMVCTVLKVSTSTFTQM